MGLEPNTYNYKVYTQLIHTLDKITQGMIYYKQNDYPSFDKLNKIEKFLSLFMLGNKDLVKYLPSHHYQPFVDILNDKPIDIKIFNKMLIEMALHDNLAGVKLFKKYGSTISDQRILIKIFDTRRTVDSTNVLNYLVNRGVDIHYSNEYPLIASIIYNDINTLKYLVEHGADIHIDNDWPIRVSAKYDNVDIVKYLTEQGANIKARGNDAIKTAVLFENNKVANYLASKGAKLF